MGTSTRELVDLTQSHGRNQEEDEVLEGRNRWPVCNHPEI